MLKGARIFWASDRMNTWDPNSDLGIVPCSVCVGARVNLRLLVSPNHISTALRYTPVAVYHSSFPVSCVLPTTVRLVTDPTSMVVRLSQWTFTDHDI